MKHHAPLVEVGFVSALLAMVVHYYPVAVEGFLVLVATVCLLRLLVLLLWKDKKHAH